MKEGRVTKTDPQSQASAMVKTSVTRCMSRDESRDALQTFGLFKLFKLAFKVPLRGKFVGLFRPNSVAEYRVVSIFTQKSEQDTVHPNIFSSKVAKKVSAITETCSWVIAQFDRL